MFLDESTYLRWAHDILEQRTRLALFIPVADFGKQPLFMWLEAAAMGLPVDPLVVGRYIAALAGLASTVGVYLLGHRLGGQRTGLVAALIYAVVPYTLFFDRIGLADGFVGTTTIWSLCVGVVIATLPTDRRRAILLGVFMGAMMGAAAWTKSTGLFALPLPLLCLLLVREPQRISRVGLAFAVGYGVAALLIGLLALVPDAENMIGMTERFALTPAEVLTLPVDRWRINVTAYVSWLLTYLPGLLIWLAIAAVPWGLVVRRRETILLLGCWAFLAIPPILTGRDLFVSRYLLSSVFPLLLLAAFLPGWAWEQRARVTKGLPQWARTRAIQWGVGIALLLAISAPSLAFDRQLLVDPSRAGLVDYDRGDYVSGWPSGYGFMEAVNLIKERAAQYDGEMILLTDYSRAQTRDGAVLYLSDNPRLHHYIDGHIPWGGKGIIEAWWPHQVPVFILGLEGLDEVDAFERNVPEAQRIGFFPKPDGKSSFRVYLIDFPKIPRPPGL
jgi:hypothetical protein